MLIVNSTLSKLTLKPHRNLFSLHDCEIATLLLRVTEGIRLSRHHILLLPPRSVDHRLVRLQPSSQHKRNREYMDRKEFVSESVHRANYFVDATIVFSPPASFACAALAPLKLLILMSEERICARSAALAVPRATDPCFDPSLVLPLRASGIRIY